jgi:hypothetical protein
MGLFSWQARRSISAFITSPLGMKKGLVPAISILVLLIIVVTLAGSTWVYLSSYSSQVTAKRVELVDTYCIGNKAIVSLKNIGTESIDIDACSGVDNSYDCGDIGLRVMQEEDSGIPIWESLTLTQGELVSLLFTCTDVCRYNLILPTGPITTQTKCSKNPVVEGGLQGGSLVFSFGEETELEKIILRSEVVELTCSKISDTQYICTDDGTTAVCYTDDEITYTCNIPDIGEHDEVQVFGKEADSSSPAGGKMDMGGDAAAAGMEEYISACRELNESGKTYYLTGDVSDNSLTSTCFRITAPSVTLDCQGYRITSDDDVAGIYSDQELTTIKYCHIEMGEGWVKQSGSQYTASGGTGIRLYNADYSYIFNSSANGQRDGLNIEKTDYAFVDRFTAYRNIWLAVRLKSSHNNVLNLIDTYDNGYPHMYGSFGKGVDFKYSNNNTLTYLFLDSDKDGGIWMTSSNYNDFTNVFIRRRADKHGNYGMWMSKSNYNTFNDLRIYSMYMYGISFQTDCTHNQFYDFKIVDTPSRYDNPYSWDSAISFYGSGSSSNTFEKGTIINSKKHSISFRSSNNLIKDVWVGNSVRYDIYAVSGNNNTLLNVTYNSVTGRGIVRQWYYMAHVEDSGGSDVEGASVYAYNTHGDLVESLITDSSGWTSMGTLTEYVGSDYYSPYTIQAEKSGYTPSSHTLNFPTGDLKNILNDQFTFQQCQDCHLSVTRDIMELSSSVFKVNLDIDVHADLDSFAIVENFPGGWTFINASHNGTEVEPGQIVWFADESGITGLPVEDTQVSYRVLKTNTSNTFFGYWETYNPPGNDTIGGDTQI